MAVAAGELAREHAQLSAEVDPDRIGVYVGSGMGGATALDDGSEAFRLGRRVAPLTVVASMTNAAAAQMAMRVVSARDSVHCDG